MSLLLCVATVALWARSYAIQDELDIGTPSGRAGILSFRGRVGFGRVAVPARFIGQIPRGVRYRSQPAGAAASSNLRPGWSSWTGLQVAYVRQMGFTAAEVRVPYWFVFLLGGLLAAVLIRRKYHATPCGFCPVCAYSLTGNVSGVCPECGTPAPLAPGGANASRCI